MNLPLVMKQIRQLPYADMMQLARYLADGIGSNTENLPNNLAAILSTAELTPGEADELTQQEEKLLRAVFRRKRSFSVKYDSGWKINADTLPASLVIGQELRPLLGQMLDQIVTMEALNSK